MRLLLDAPACRQLIHIGSQTYADRRRYYVVENSAIRFLLVARRGIEPQTLAGCVVDANVGWETGMQGFCYERHVGKRITKVTVYGKLPDRKAEATLSDIIAGAPRD